MCAVAPYIPKFFTAEAAAAAISIFHGNAVCGQRIKVLIFIVFSLGVSYVKSLVVCVSNVHVVPCHRLCSQIRLLPPAKGNGDRIIL